MCNDSLYKKMKELFDKHNNWYYYSSCGNIKSFNPFDVNNNDIYDRAINFIKEYFKAGGKGVFNIGNIDENFLDKKRSIHTISAFFLGLLINKDLGLNGIQGNNGNEFFYRWYLTCLYHDIFYLVENDKVKYKPSEFSYKKILSKFDVNNDLFNIKNRDFINYKLVRNYYDYCIFKRDKIDHGILGGLVLYDRLVKNFKEVYKKAQKDDESINEEDFLYKELTWSEKDKKIYAKIARAIIEHNMWVCKPSDSDSDSELYKSFGLDELIKEPIIFSNKNSLLFLLALTDSIEPTKFFSNCNPIEVLKNINIEFEPKSKSKSKSGIKQIIITVNSSVLDYNKWFESIEKLKVWLSVNVNVSINSNELKISLN